MRFLHLIRPVMCVLPEVRGARTQEAGRGAAAGSPCSAEGEGAVDEASTSRPLGQHENFFYVAQKAFGCLDVMVSRMTVKLPADYELTEIKLQEAYKKVTARHPLLRSTVTVDSDGKRCLTVRDADEL